jgi:hypothetical protein
MNALALLLSLAACATTGTPPDAALDAAVASAARELAAELAERPDDAPIRLAVMPPRTTPSRFAELARDLRHRVGDHLRGRVPRLVFVERDDLEALWTEHNLSASGLLDPRATAELGRLLGADALLLGELVEFDERPQLHLRIVDVRTGEQLALVTRSLAIGGATGSEAPDGDLARRAAPSAGDGAGSPSTPTKPGDSAGEAATSPTEPPSDDPPPAAVPLGSGRFAVGDFRVALAGCGFVRQQVVCRVELENLAPGPRTLRVLGATRIYDMHGQGYRLQRVRSGTRVDDLTAIAHTVRTEHPGGLEATLELTFSGISRRKRKLQLVDLRFAEGHCDFRDVPLSRD